MSIGVCICVCVCVRAVNLLLNQLPTILQAYNRWRMRIATPLLNDWLRQYTKMHGTASQGRNTFRVKYITQARGWVVGGATPYIVFCCACSFVG
jgi:predicted GTPase